MKKTIIFILLILVSACSFENEGLDKLKELCEKDAGLTIYKTVKADGYYDASRKSGALRMLIPSKFSFTEFCNFKPNIASLFNDAGCWRLTKISRVDGKCNEEVDKSLYSSGGNSYPKYRVESCIAVEKIEKPMARYSYFSSPTAWFDRNKLSEFRRSDAYIKDNFTSKVVGRYVSYSYNTSPRHSSPQSCHVIDEKYISYSEANLINSVIIPFENTLNLQGELK